MMCRSTNDDDAGHGGLDGRVSRHHTDRTYGIRSISSPLRIYGVYGWMDDGGAGPGGRESSCIHTDVHRARCSPSITHTTHASSITERARVHHRARRHDTRLIVHERLSLCTQRKKERKKGGGAWRDVPDETTRHHRPDGRASRRVPRVRRSRTTDATGQRDRARSVARVPPGVARARAFVPPVGGWVWHCWVSRR